MDEQQRSDMTSQAFATFARGLGKVLMVLAIKYPDLSEGLSDMSSAMDTLVELANDD